MRTVTTVVCASMMAVSGAGPADAKTSAKLYRVNGRPVPASCLEGLTSLEGDRPTVPIDLRTCGSPIPRPRVNDDGSVGYSKQDGSYFSYFYVGQAGGMDILSLQSSGGGTGRFTQLVGVKPSAHLIRMEGTRAAGDRCNGGISAARISGGRLMFDQAITPYDLVALGQPRIDVKAYRDLESSATSCIGVVHRVDDDKHWTGVSLSGGARPDQKGWTPNFRYQACFNQLYREAAVARRTELRRENVGAFGRVFAARCMKTG